MDYGKYIESLSSDHYDALSQICSDFSEMHADNVQKMGNSWTSSRRSDYQMYFHIAWKFIDKFNLDFDAERTANNNGIAIFFTDLTDSSSAWLAGQIFDRKFSDTLNCITLNDVEKEEIQNLTTSLRDSINKAKWLEDEKKQRLLNSVNEFQSELDKEIGDYYRRLGMLKDLGSAIGEFGQRAMPMADLVEKISNSFVKIKRPKLLGKTEDPKQIEDLRKEE
ncbi:MAG: hypothetical protein JKX71_03510 [Amylibacter sp.]|nr:hypothetical protein [Amylibacter sp.]